MKKSLISKVLFGSMMLPFIMVNSNVHAAPTKLTSYELLNVLHNMKNEDHKNFVQVNKKTGITVETNRLYKVSCRADLNPDKIRKYKLLHPQTETIVLKSTKLLEEFKYDDVLTALHDAGIKKIRLSDCLILLKSTSINILHMLKENNFIVECEKLILHTSNAPTELDFFWFWVYTYSNDTFWDPWYAYEISLDDLCELIDASKVKKIEVVVLGKGFKVKEVTKQKETNFFNKLKMYFPNVNSLKLSSR